MVGDDFVMSLNSKMKRIQIGWNSERSTYTKIEFRKSKNFRNFNLIGYNLGLKKKY